MTGCKKKQLLAAMVRLRPAVDEDLVEFVVRRNRHAARIARQVGLWSNLHVKRCQDWHAHLLRERNARSFAAVLVKCRDAKFLATMRALMRRNAAPRGTGTRSLRGWPRPRSEEHVLQASER